MYGSIRDVVASMISKSRLLLHLSVFRITSYNEANHKSLKPSATQSDLVTTILVLRNHHITHN